MTQADREFVQTVARCFALGLRPEETAAELGTAATRISSWEAVAWLLQRHGCSTIAYHLLQHEAIRPACPIPPAVIAELRERYVSLFARVTTEPPVLHRAIEALSQAGIPSLAVKGPVLGSWLYGDPVLRPHGDLDLIVPETLAGACDDVLKALGYRPEDRANSLPRLSPRELLSTATYLDPRGHPPLDISFDPLRLFWRPAGGTTAWFDGWWERRRMVVVGGRSCATFGREDDVIYLLRHLQFHDFFRTIWFVDVLLLLSKHSDEIDWEFVGRTARAHALHGGLYRALELLESAYGFRAPQVAWAVLRPGPLVRRLHRRIWPDSVALPRDHHSLGGSPVVPRFISPRGSHPVAAALLLATRPHRRLSYGYLYRRFVPTREWLRAAYAGQGERSTSYPVLLARHLRRLREIRRQVMTGHEAEQS